MFDKLIESNLAEAEFKPRRKFFMLSSVVVGILFLSAVVFSLYAQDIDLGTDNFDLAVLLAPVAADAPEPEPPKAAPEQRSESATNELPSRQKLIASIDQPQEVPTEISTTPNKFRSIPLGRFNLNPSAPESDGYGPTGPGRNNEEGSSATEAVAVDPVKVSEPPPIIKTEPRKPVTKSKGVINGEALALPRPNYPSIALQINLTGSVNVQVLIDEAGNVVSAKAVDGHPFFKAEAERAARKAKFKPTLLSDVPVKVTGVIVYRFSR